MTGCGVVLLHDARGPCGRQPAAEELADDGVVEVAVVHGQRVTHFEQADVVDDPATHGVQLLQELRRVAEAEELPEHRVLRIVDQLVRGRLLVARLAIGDEQDEDRRLAGCHHAVGVSELHDVVHHRGVVGTTHMTTLTPLVHEALVGRRGHGLGRVGPVVEEEHLDGAVVVEAGQAEAERTLDGRLDFAVGVAVARELHAAREVDRDDHLGTELAEFDTLRLLLLEELDEAHLGGFGALLERNATGHVVNPHIFQAEWTGCPSGSA